MEEETIFENWNDDTESSNFMTQEALDVENRENLPLQDTTLENMEESEGIDEPYVGKEFKCLDDAMKYYNSYALMTGFGIRKGSSYKSKKLCFVTAQSFTFSNEGWPKNKQKEVMIGEGAHKDITPQKESSSMRTGCKASMRVRMEDDNKWVITSFFKGHNHVLLPSPSKARFFRCRRKIGEEEKALIQTEKQNIPPKQIVDVIASQHGGIRNVSFTRKDLSNHTTRLRRSLFDIDISTTVNYFQQLQAANPMFYYAIQIDLDNTARNIFWVDGKSRMAYQFFGDVVTFDTTYMTNKYDMPFAPFIGVNHHGQSTLFGCALIRDETSESFAWLFRTWTTAMFGCHPKSILTDQDPAMKKAISEVFRNTVHRFCKWQILRKAREHLGVLFNVKDKFKHDFLFYINMSLTIEESESNWASMIEKYELADNSHLRHLYGIRQFWIPAFFRDTFFSFMETTQRSESINALFKTFVDRHTSIFRFVEQYEKALENRYDREDEEDFLTMSSNLSLWSMYPIEKHAQAIYTRSMFKFFKDQLRETTNFELEIIEPYNLYKLSHVINSEKAHYRRREYMVIAKSPLVFSCACKMFEFSDMLYTHVLSVLLHLKVREIPSHYILKRWTKLAKEVSVDINVSPTVISQETSSKTLRFNALCRRVMKLVAEGSISSETYDLAIQRIDSTVNELFCMRKQIQNNTVQCETSLQGRQMASSQASQSNIVSETCTIRDPPKSNCKGSKRMRRFKPQSELKAKKSQTCQICH